MNMTQIQDCAKAIIWTRDEALHLIATRLWTLAEAHEHYIGLTGSVLIKGVSSNDLDLVLYPRYDLHTDYRPVALAIAHNLRPSDSKLNVVERPDSKTEYKLIVTTFDTADRRVELFFPSWAFAGRLDNWPTVESKEYNDNPSQP